MLLVEVGPMRCRNHEEAGRRWQGMDVRVKEGREMVMLGVWA